MTNKSVDAIDVAQLDRWSVRAPSRSDWRAELSSPQRDAVLGRRPTFEARVGGIASDRVGAAGNPRL